MKGIALLLDSIRLSPPGDRWDFMWNKNKSMLFCGGFGFEFYIDFDKSKLASLMFIKENPVLLEGFSIEKARGLLTDFFQEVIEDIGIDSLFFSRDRNRSVLELTPDHTLAILEEKIQTFLLERLKNSIFCMPVSGIPCLAEKIDGELMWVSGNFNLYEILKDVGVSVYSLQNSTFPPLSVWDGNRNPLSSNDSWFIVKAKDDSIAESYFRRMTGALSIVIGYPYSRFITGRKIIDGRIKFKPGGSNSFNALRSTIPGVVLPVEVKKQAAQRADKLFWKLCSGENDKRLQICLQYLADSWGKSRVISFINTSIAMDALFGVNGKVTQSILTGVEANCVSLDRSSERYALILKIRNGVLHGEYSSLELSPSYLDYYEKYNDDPIDDQIRILEDCLTSLMSGSDIGR